VQIVIVSVDRSQEDTVVVNTTVDLLHCPVRFSKEGLRQLGYHAYRPVLLKPVVTAAVEREVARRGRIPLGGFTVAADDMEGLPPNPNPPKPARPREAPTA
jgi:hypothetical protein